jgi:hypothetical protein
VLVAIACAAAAVTEVAGLHPAIGAFCAGVVVGHAVPAPAPAASAPAPAAPVLDPAAGPVARALGHAGHEPGPALAPAAPASAGPAPAPAAPALAPAAPVLGPADGPASPALDPAAPALAPVVPVLGPADRPAVPALDPAALVTPVASLLAPLYFVLVGRAVDLGRLDARLAADIAAVAAVAVVGKLAGAYLGARLGGLAPHPAGVFAVLMNTRGVTELVFVAIGLGLGVIDGALYTAMVVMALATTAMTGPLLTRLSRQREGV